MIPDDLPDRVESRIGGQAEPVLQTPIDTHRRQTLERTCRQHPVQHLFELVGEVLADRKARRHGAGTFRRLLPAPADDRSAPACDRAHPLHDLGGVRERQAVEERVGDTGSITKPADKIGIADLAVRRDRFSIFLRQIVPTCATRW